METIEVLRVENAEGAGPYATGATRNLWLDAGEDDCYCPRRCPAPLRFLLNSEHRFGFLTRAHLDRWFTPGARAKLATAGYQVTRYRVPIARVVLTATQCAFELPHATRVGCEPLVNPWEAHWSDWRPSADQLPEIDEHDNERAARIRDAREGFTEEEAD